MKHTPQQKRNGDAKKILQKNYEVGVEIHIDVNREEQRSFSTTVPLTCNTCQTFPA
uniref:Uncharacterized protein n=1 Tax=Solanum tuberosum TaxID=4113 RepID=M1CHM2_SOLTU